jgi:hypothetical protein
MKEVIKELQENYNEIEGLLGSNIKQSADMQNIPKYEYMVGYFSSKVQSAASSALVSYLNKIIHILLEIPSNVRKNNADDLAYQEEMDINLITFKIGDLFRCKCKSKENEIIKIFK